MRGNRTITGWLGLLCAAGVGAGVFPSAAAASPILDDVFDTDHSGVGVLNFNGFRNWTVTGGTVDLIGSGYFDFFPGHGMYVDLDGSTRDPGLLASHEFTLTPGTYNVTFSLGGNQRGAAADDVTVGFGDWTETFRMLSSDPLTPITRTINIPAPTVTRLTFQNSGGDNIGAILDDVSIISVPSPAGAVLLGAASVGLAWRARRARG